MHLSIVTPRPHLPERAGPMTGTGHSSPVAEGGWKGSTYFLRGDWSLIHPGDLHEALDSMDILPKVLLRGFFPVLYK